MAFQSQIANYKWLFWLKYLLIFRLYAWKPRHQPEWFRLADCKARALTIFSVMRFAPSSKGDNIYIEQFSIPA